MSALSRGAAHKWCTGFFQGHPFVKTILKIISGAPGGGCGVSSWGFSCRARVALAPRHLRNEISAPGRVTVDLKYPFCKDAAGSVAAIGEQLAFSVTVLASRLLCWSVLGWRAPEGTNRCLETNVLKFSSGKAWGNGCSVCFSVL